MSEFLNRIDLQRKAIKIVNSSNSKVQLTGLSLNTINSWCQINNINKSEKVVKELLHLSEKLFFLANKSQEQVTEDYKEMCNEIDSSLSRLREAL